MDSRKGLTSETTSDTITAPEDDSECHVHLYIPEVLEDADQQLAYQEFIRSLSAILVKYAAEINLED